MPAASPTRTVRPLDARAAAPNSAARSSSLPCSPAPLLSSNAPYIHQKFSEAHGLDERGIGLAGGLAGGVAGVIGELVRLDDQGDGEHLLGLVEGHADLHAGGGLGRAGIDDTAIQRMGDEQGQIVAAALLL